jgi:hypothetical protein
LLLIHAGLYASRRGNLKEQGRSVDLVFAGAAGDHFMARTDTEILFGKTSDLPEPHPERGATFTVTPSAYAQNSQGGS